MKNNHIPPVEESATAAVTDRGRWHMASPCDSIFYSTPAEVIRDLCDVTLRQAKAYKSGRCAPHPSVVKLVVLHSEGRILGPSWAGWCAQGATITDPEGKSTTVDQLRAYPFVWALAREFGRDNPRVSSVLDGYASLAAERVKRVRPRKLSDRELQRRDEMEYVYAQMAQRDKEARARKENDEAASPVIVKARG